MKMLTLTLILFTTISITSSPSYAAREKEAILAVEVLFDDSGVLTDPERAKNYKLLLLGHLKGLTRKRRYANARIDVISTSFGRSVWIGSPRDLKRGPHAEALIPHTESHKNYCNNLPGAFAELQSNLQQLERQNYQEIIVIVFSSLIDTPRPCENTVELTLPQMPPPMDINAILTSSKAIRSITFYWSNPHQKKIWTDMLEPTIRWSKNHNTPFGLFDIENTIYEIEGMKGVIQ